MSGAWSGRTGAELHRAADPARDQSYFLFATTREQLDYLRFPLGDLPKPAVREIARELGLVVADKPDSQDICFVPDGDYARGGEEGAARGGACRARSSTATGGCSARHPRPDPLHRRPAPRARDRRPGRAALRRPARAGEPARRGRAEGARWRCAARGSTGINWLGEGQRDGLTAKVRSLARPAPARFDGESRALRRARIWRRAGPGGGALRGRPRARRRLDRGDRGGGARAGLTAGDGIEQQAAPPAAPPSTAQDGQLDCAAAQRQTSEPGGDHRQHGRRPGLRRLRQARRC